MLRLLTLGAAAGAALQFFLDSVSGRRRRSMTRDRSLAVLRRRRGQAAGLGRGAIARGTALKQRATHLHEEVKPQPDDVTLARKVESVIFRPADAPKGQIDVNAEEGVVYLRGEVDRPELIDELVEATRKIQGVRGVESLLHLPGQAPQMKQ